MFCGADYRNECHARPLNTQIDMVSYMMEGAYSESSRLPSSHCNHDHTDQRGMAYFCLAQTYVPGEEV